MPKVSIAIHARPLNSEPGRSRLEGDDVAADAVDRVVVLEPIAILVGEADRERKGGDTLGLEDRKTRHAATPKPDPVDADVALLDLSPSWSA